MPKQKITNAQRAHIQRSMRTLRAWALDNNLEVTWKEAEHHLKNATGFTYDALNARALRRVRREFEGWITRQRVNFNDADTA